MACLLFAWLNHFFVECAASDGHSKILPSPMYGCHMTLIYLSIIYSWYVVVVSLVWLLLLAWRRLAKKLPLALWPFGVWPFTAPFACPNHRGIQLSHTHIYVIAMNFGELRECTKGEWAVDSARCNSSSRVGREELHSANSPFEPEVGLSSWWINQNRNVIQLNQSAYVKESMHTLRREDDQRRILGSNPIQPQPMNQFDHILQK